MLWYIILKHLMELYGNESALFQRFSKFGTHDLH